MISVNFIDQISPDLKAKAFMMAVAQWDEQEAEAAVAFDNLMECDEEELPGVIEALGIQTGFDDEWLRAVVFSRAVLFEMQRGQA